MTELDTWLFAAAPGDPVRWWHVVDRMVGRPEDTMSTCVYSGLGLYDKGDLPKTEYFKARCECGQIVLVRGGRIDFHETTAA